MSEELLREQIRAIENQHPYIFLSYKGRKLRNPFTIQEKNDATVWDNLISELAELIIPFRDCSKRGARGQYKLNRMGKGINRD